MNHSNQLSTSFQENKIFLSCPYASKEKLVKEYRRKYDEKAKAEELYLLILSELEKAIIECDLDHFKKLSNLIDCINEIEDQKTLNDFYSNSNNPLQSTNFVILACKHNKLKILKYLFENSNKFITDVSIGVRRTIIPQDKDEEGHNVFYYAIRSGNIDLLDTLFNEWLGDYFAACLEEFDEILSRAYEDLKLKNVPLSEKIEIFVESKLIDLRFFSDVSRHAHSAKTNLSNIKQRIGLVLENISLLKEEYLNSKEVNEKFFFIAKFVAQNIHILKRQLKSTYDRLPWEEMEFCLLSFISSYMKPQEINLFYRATLNKKNILNHLANFAVRLEDEKHCLENVTVDELAKLPKLQREKVVANIISNCPEFEDLYNGHQQIRDIYSLEKICYCVKLASSANPEQREGQLIIIRVLQVTGEFLKNTLESPNLSNATSELLLLSLPKNTRKIITNLRNSLSHANSLSKRIEIEENTNSNFFTNIQNDTQKVGDVVTDLLHNYKLKILRLLLQKIATSKNLDELQDVSEILSNTDLNEMPLENFIKMEQKKLEDLLIELNDTITEKTIYENDLFSKINSIISSTKTKSESTGKDYFISSTLLKLLGIFWNGNRIDYNIIRVNKFMAKLLLQKIAPQIDSHRLKDIAYISYKIFCSVSSRMQQDKLEKVAKLFHKIAYSIEFETADIKWINELKEKLNKKGSNISVYKDRNTYNDSKEKYNKQFTLKLSELKNVLKTYTLSGKSIEDLPLYKSDRKLQTLVEMYILDIMSILEDSKILENNLLFLDDNAPILTGKCLRNHIAHDNALVHLLLSDPSNAVILNAKKLISENLLENKKKLGKLVKDDPLKLEDKYSQSLNIVTNQERMFSAVEEGNIEDLKCCLKKGADINARNINSWTSLHFAAKGPSLEVVKLILDQNLDINAKDVNGQTSFHIAAAYGREKFLKFFEMKADCLVNDKDNRGKTPLHYAAQNGHKDVVEILINSKANTSARDFASRSPLHYAIMNNHIDITKILLDKEVHVDYNEVMGGYTPLHLAAENGHLEIVNFLLRKGANVNTKNDNGGTPLHAAVLNGNLEVVTALILNGAHINSRLIDGCTPLDYAVENGYELIANFLLKHGATVNVGNKTYNYTPLHYAAHNGHEEIVKALLKNKANACITTVYGTTALHLAAQSGHLNIVAALLKCEVHICTKDKNYNTVLHYAAENGHKMVAELLISKGAQINARNNDNMTPLHVAAEKGHRDFIYLLITSKADVEARDIKGDTPLHKAAMNDCEDIIDLLIKNEADVNARNNAGMTPLYLAVLNGHKDIVVYLLKNKAEVNVKTNTGCTPLHEAVTGANKDIINLLIENGALVNTADITDFTPLHMAVKAGKKEIVEVLLAQGAKVSLQNETQIPLLSAIRCNNKDIVEILIAYGAIVNAEALELAVFAGYRDIVEILLKHDANLNLIHPGNETTLHLAAELGDTHIVDALVTKGAEVDSLTINNITPLHLAAYAGHAEIIEVLIANGARVNVKSSDGSTPLHLAVFNGCIDVVKVLLDNKINVTVKDNKNRTPLELAVAHGHLKVVKMLLQYEKIDMNTNGNDDWTLLHIASQGSNLEMVKYLVNEGSNINARNCSNSKPIHIAAREGHRDIVEFFLNKGSSINELGACNQTLLHYAAMKGHFEIVKYLIKQGAHVNVKDTNGITPMHIGAKFGFKNVIQLLLENGAVYNILDKFYREPVETASDQSVINLLSWIEKLFDAVKHNNCSDVEKYIKLGAFVNAKNDAGEMPIHYAAWKGHEEIVNILLQFKADPNTICKKGLRPLHYAAKFSHLKIVKALLSNGAIYNAVSDAGKTPLDFSTDGSIAKLFKLLRESFEKIEKGNSNVVNELNRIKDVDTIKAIMGACNRENKTLIVAAMHSNFSKVEQLKQISQPDVSTQVSKAQVFLNQGKYQEAFNIFESAFIKRKEILGPNNPGTLDIQIDMAKARYKQGMYQEALNMLETIFQNQERILGLDDKDTLNTRGMVALVLHRQEKNEDSYAVYQEVFQKQKETLGPNHPDTLNTQLHMALVLDGQGKYEEALNINRKIFELWKSTLGAYNPATISAQNNMAMVLGNQGKYEEALKIYKEVFEKKKMVLGINHSDTIRTFQSIACFLSKQRKFHEALEAFQAVINMQKVNLGKYHPEFLSTQYNLGNMFLVQGKFIRAFKVYNEYFDQIKAVFGPNHKTVLDISRKIDVIKLKLRYQFNSTSEILLHLQEDINIAATNGDVQVVQGFLEDGADVNDKDKEGRTPLHYAVTSGHAGTVSLLLNNGAYVNDKDIEGRTPLHYAVNSGYTCTVSLLLNNGADVTQATNKGNTPLHTATSKGHMEIIVNLLQHASNDKLNDFINAKTTSSGTTSLHIAAKNGSLEIVMSLLKYGASYNTKDKEGKTALDYSKHQNIVEFLELVEKLFEDAKKGTFEIITKLEAVKPEEFSAIVNARNVQGKTLLQVTIINKHKTIARKLLEMLKLQDKNS